MFQKKPILMDDPGCFRVGILMDDPCRLHVIDIKCTFKGRQRDNRSIPNLLKRLKKNQFMFGKDYDRNGLEF